MEYTSIQHPIVINDVSVPVDWMFGPWDSVDLFKSALSDNGIEITDLAAGTTIGIKENGKVVEYWNPAVSSPFNFEKKTGGSVQSEAVLDIIDQMCTESSELNTLFPNSSIGKMVVYATENDTQDAILYVKITSEQWVSFSGSFVGATAVAESEIEYAHVLSYK